MNPPTGTRGQWRSAHLELFAGRSQLIVHQLLGRAPKGREAENQPAGEWWWRRHNEYGSGQCRSA
jgi:predicted dithiol-disulfide oxidoreductase (DUF899 family)